MILVKSNYQVIIFIRWYEFGLLKLNDMERNIDLEVYTQSVPVPATIVGLISDDTPKDYEYISTGFSIPVAHFMASNLKVRQPQLNKNYCKICVFNF